MQTLITTLFLTSAFLASPQSVEQDTTSRRLNQVQVQNDDARKTQMEEHLTLSIYTPQLLTASSLVNYVNRLAKSSVTYYKPTSNGGLTSVEVSRFIAMENVVGVQDFPGSAEEALEYLAEIDARLGAAKSTPVVADSTGSETLRLTNLDGRLVHALVSNSCPLVAVGSMKDTPLITLAGPIADVARAVSILKEADQPLPQIVLQWTLLEAVDDVDPGEAASAAIATALQPFAPGKKFRRGQSFTVRGAAGGNQLLRVASSIKGLHSDSSSVPSRVELSATAESFDPEAKRLNLGACSIFLERTEKLETPLGKQKSVALDELTTSLSLRAGETTVLGSLGGDPVWVALTFTLIP